MSQIFISYARKDDFFVDRLREDLKRANIEYWIDHEGLSPGTSSWELAIRDALKICESVLWIVSPASFASAYVRDEISIARMYERKIYPIFADGENWLECVPLGTGEIQFIDARTDYNIARDKILETLGASEPEFIVPDEPKPSLPEDQEPRNPFKGLSAFTEKDADDFFGREALVKKLEERITARLSNKQDRFLVVIGPSGAGKSSVVMAGLIPSLKKNQDNWTFLPKIVPGNHPVEALADALYSVMSDKRLSDIEADLNSRGGRMLHRLSRQIEAEQVVLYIDQFEEVFTLTNNESERQQFIDLIVQAATESDGKMLILLSMRADFYGHPMNYPHLGALVEANNVGVLPMSISELHDAIEKPARLPDVALTFDSGLVAEIVFALRERDKALAGALPLLQFTLERLFAERDGTHLNFVAYQAMGGVQGAIGTHCEDVFSQLPYSAQEKLGQAFLPLVNIDENTGEATRRRGELETVIADPDAKVLVDALIKNRILQTGREGKQIYLEIAHESLFRSWERLVKWIEVAHDDLRLLRQIEREAADWDKSYILSSERLQPIHAAIERLDYQLSASTQDFVYPQQMLLKELDNPETSEQRRLRIGDDLALLGDPRKGVGVKDGLPDIIWLPVMGSEQKVTIKTDENEIGSIDIPHFFISKFLTTDAQYQAFVDAEDGYNNQQWWEGFPEEYQPQRLGEQRTKSANNPRDSISWYQSVAFGRWMTLRFNGLELKHPSGAVLRVGDNAQIRIPTEWEWQWVAMNGAEERQYPWGNNWQGGHADTSESGLGRAIAVGMYPHGKAQCGALDMSGNLFEWCANNRDDPEIIDVTNESSKVLRGGSFGSNYYYARSVSRYNNNPDLDYLSYGVRCVVSPILLWPLNPLDSDL